MGLRIFLIILCSILLLGSGTFLFFLIKKPSRLTKIKFLNSPKKQQILKLTLSALVALLLGFLLVIIIKPSILKLAPETKTTNQLDTKKLEKLAKEMKEGKPKTQTEDDSDKAPFYEAITAHNNHYVYYTNISDDTNLIKFTDEILAKLKSEEKITDETKSYYVDFFSDREVAKDYFKIMQEKDTTTGKKLAHLPYYFARFQYYKTMGINQLVRLPSNQTIKDYRTNQN